MRNKKSLSMSVDVTENASTKTFTGHVILTVYGEDAGDAWFIVEEDRIYLSELDIVHGFQRHGLGRIIVNLLMSIAEEEKKPLTVTSLIEASRFYKKCGMTSCTDNKDPRVKIRFTFLKPNKHDYFWIPKSLDKRKRIFVTF